MIEPSKLANLIDEILRRYLALKGRQTIAQGVSPGRASGEERNGNRPEVPRAYALG